jgi:hypothetical protein
MDSPIARRLKYCGRLLQSIDQRIADHRDSGQGLASELANHKGHRVEIEGQLLSRGPAVSGSTSPAAATQRIAVQSVKMLSAQCESQPTR